MAEEQNESDESRESGINMIDAVKGAAIGADAGAAAGAAAVVGHQALQQRGSVTEDEESEREGEGEGDDEDEDAE